MPLQDRRDEALVRRAFRRFALLSVSFLGVVVVGVVIVADLQASNSAEADAGTRGEVVAAAVHAGLADPDRDATDPEFAEAIETAATRAGVRAVLVWDHTGTVVWSTRSTMVGETYRLDPDVRELFGATVPLTVEGDGRLDTARPLGLLGNEIEVFSPIEDASGHELVVESYVDRSAVGITRAETLRLLLPLGLASMVLFEGLALLAGAQLARRVQASRRERIGLITRSLAAIDHERRLLAHNLHDGVVQDLAAMRYALSGLAETIPDELPENPRRQLQRISDVLEHELIALRATLGELLPVERDQLPLPETLTRVVDRLVPSPITWSVDVDPRLHTVDPGTAELVQRITQEGVRNAVRHARPSSVQVRVLDEEGPTPQVRVVVDDDGAGLRSDREGQPHEERHAGHHLGIRLLRDLVEDLAGRLTLSERPSGGTRLDAVWTRSVPDGLPDLDS